MARPSPDQSLIGDLEKAHYVAADEQVEKLARLYTKTTEAGERVRGSYLRILVAAAQERLKALPAKKKFARRLSQTEIGQQLPVVEEVHGRFYIAVLRGVTTPDVTDHENLEEQERTRRALERNRRSGFARSAKSTLVAFVKAGGDIRQLIADEVSKTSLRQYITTVEPPSASTEVLEARITRGALHIEEIARELADKDKLAATSTVEVAMRKLAALLAELGGRGPTPKPDVAMREGRPLDLGETGVFFPMPIAPPDARLAS
jgi:hypothetical protein